MIDEIAFVAYPATDMKRAQEFYSKILGLRETANWENVWIEYEIGSGALAITSCIPLLKPGASGAAVGLEVRDLDALLAGLKKMGVTSVSDPFDTPVCRSAIIKDPDANPIILHQRKQKA